ncbi:MAG: DUF4145 domain-containing protein [Maricaulaceae bacterium]|jgi:hypothetical protein
MGDFAGSKHQTSSQPLELPQPELESCPHCGVSHPGLKHQWNGDGAGVAGAVDQTKRFWKCTACGNLITERISQFYVNLGNPREQKSYWATEAVFPRPRSIPGCIPDLARQYLKEAYDVRAAPNACVMVTASSIDAMLVDQGYEETSDKESLASRIDRAIEGGLLPEHVGKWAHKIRALSNHPRHVDKKKPTVTPEESETCLELALAIADMLYVYPSKLTDAFGGPASAPASTEELEIIEPE